MWLPLLVGFLAGFIVGFGVAAIFHVTESDDEAYYKDEE